MVPERARCVDLVNFIPVAAPRSVLTVHSDMTLKGTGVRPASSALLEEPAKDAKRAQLACIEEQTILIC